MHASASSSSSDPPEEGAGAGSRETGSSRATGAALDRGAFVRGPDRRRSSTPRLSRYSFFGGRRHRVRRTEELEGSFVDLYGPRLWLLLLWVALMNVADSYFTLIHLQAGGVELNPVAAALLGTGRTNFVLSKSILIALALVVLCVHKNFFLARLGLWCAAGTYTLLVTYHVTLFFVG